MKLATWLRGLATAMVAIGLLVAVSGVFTGCSSEKPNAGGSKEKPAKQQDETPKKKPEAAKKPGPEEKPAPAEKPGPEQKPAPAEKPAAAAGTGKTDASPTAKISTYAPAEDLAAQVPEYLKDLGEAVASEEAYKDDEEKVGKYSNALIVITLALGMHDQENQYKAAAPAMVTAAQDLAAAKDYAAAKKAFDALQTAADGKGPAGGELKWEKQASLDELMKAVPLISNKIRERSLSGSRLKKKAKDYAGYSAVLAVIGQAALPYADETEAPKEVEKWQAYCMQMRSDAATLGADIRAGNGEAAVKALGALKQTCEDCHKVFHNEELETTTTEEEKK